MQNGPQIANGHRVLAQARRTAAQYIYGELVPGMATAAAGLGEVERERAARINANNNIAAQAAAVGVVPRANGGVARGQAGAPQGGFGQPAANPRDPAGQAGAGRNQGRAPEQPRRNGGELGAALPDNEWPVDVDLVIVGGGSANRYRVALPYVRRCHIIEPSTGVDDYVREADRVDPRVLPLTGSGGRVTACGHKLRDCRCCQGFGQPEQVRDEAVEIKPAVMLFVFEHTAYYMARADWLQVPVGANVVMVNHVFPKAAGYLPQNNPEYSYEVVERRNRDGRPNGTFEVHMASLSMYDAGRTYVHTDITQQLISGVWDIAEIGDEEAPVHHALVTQICRTVFGDGEDEFGNPGREALMCISKGVCRHLPHDALVMLQDEQLMLLNQARAARAAGPQAKQLGDVQRQQMELAKCEVRASSDLDEAVGTPDIGYTAQFWEVTCRKADDLIGKIPQTCSNVAFVETMNRIRVMLKSDKDCGYPTEKIVMKAMHLAWINRKQFHGWLQDMVCDEYVREALVAESFTGGFKLIMGDKDKAARANLQVQKAKELLKGVTGFNAVLDLVAQTRSKYSKVAPF